MCPHFRFEKIFYICHVIELSLLLLFLRYLIQGKETEDTHVVMCINTKKHNLFLVVQSYDGHKQFTDSDLTSKCCAGHKHWKPTQHDNAIP